MKNELKRIRTEKGISQEELAKELGVSGGFISLVESADKPFPMWMALKLADKFNISLDELMGRTCK